MSVKTGTSSCAPLGFLWCYFHRCCTIAWTAYVFVTQNLPRCNVSFVGRVGMPHKDLNMHLGYRQAAKLLLQWHLCEPGLRSTKIFKGMRREKPPIPVWCDGQQEGYVQMWSMSLWALIEECKGECVTPNMMIPVIHSQGTGKHISAQGRCNLGKLIN